MNRKKKTNCILAIALASFLLLAFTFIFPNNISKQGPFFLLSWLGGTLIVLSSFISYNYFWLKPQERLVRKAETFRIIAVIPSYNEDQMLLDSTIESILKQTVFVQEIHVVDDGSQTPLKELNHPNLFYHYQENRGKRYAQKKALDSVNSTDFTHFLAVDSDSILAPNALELLVCAFERDPQLKACTGVVLTRNRPHNLLTKIADLNIGITCLIGRPIRSLLGSLETTSGALALYDSQVVYNHLEDYVTSGTYSDDRQLCLYSLLYGKAIGLSEAVVYSEMPTTFKQTANQRFRWAKGSWKAMPFQLKHLNPKQLLFPVIGMLYLATLPFFIFMISYYALTGSGHFLLSYLIIRLGVRYFQALLYLLARPDYQKKELCFYLLLVIPLEFFFNLIVLVFLKYKALFHLKETAWLTRDPKTSENT